MVSKPSRTDSCKVQQAHTRDPRLNLRHPVFFPSLPLCFAVPLCSCTTDDWWPFFFLPLAFRQSAYRPPFPQAPLRDRRNASPTQPNLTKPKKVGGRQKERKKERKRNRLLGKTYKALFRSPSFLASFISLPRKFPPHTALLPLRASTRTNLVSRIRLISGTTMAFLQAFKFGSGLWDPSHRYETSWLLPPWLLFFSRALFVRLSQKPSPLS